ncbi:hypothetical protein V8B97DRAFT_1543791 [Scleroderma yunnanense]
MGGTTPISKRPHASTRPLSTGGIIRMTGCTLLSVSLIFSICFILALLCAFGGDDEDEPYFRSILNEVASTSPGIVLLGENVDVDVDEPSIGIRWSILGCGDGYVLDGSAGVHESGACGLPAMYLQIYVDNSVQPTAVYDPSQLPYISETGRRRNIQNLVQFDSDHVLDVHLDRLYPFDTYLLTTTLYAIDISGASVPIQKIATIDQVSSFQIGCSDMASYELVASNGTRFESRDMDLKVQRPGQACAFALALFGLSWMLTHATIASVFVARKHDEVTPVIRYIVLALTALLVIPQLRNAMPDAPGYDGVLIDCIGFFPQMILTSGSVVALVLVIMLREFNGLSGSDTMSTVSVDIRAPPPPSPLKRLILEAKRGSVILEHGEEKHHKPQGLNLKDYTFPPRRQQHLRSRSSRTVVSCELGIASSGRSVKKDA